MTLRADSEVQYICIVSLEFMNTIYSNRLLNDLSCLVCINDNV